MLRVMGTFRGKVPGHVRDGVARPARPGQSVAERMPEFALDWHQELNGDATPDTVAWKSGLRAAWRCRRCNLRTERTVAGKAWTYETTGPQGGCRSRICARLPRDMPQPGDSMRDRYDAELVASFDKEENAPNTPDTGQLRIEAGVQVALPSGWFPSRIYAVPPEPPKARVPYLRKCGRHAPCDR